MVSNWRRRTWLLLSVGARLTTGLIGRFAMDGNVCTRLSAEDFVSAGSVLSAY